MMQTFKNFQQLSSLYEGTPDLTQITLQYQQTEDPVLLAVVFCKWFPFVVRTSEKYFYLTESDKSSYAVEELHKAMKDFSTTGGAQIQTLYSRYLNNRLRTETQQLNKQKRSANNTADSYELMAGSSEYRESAYSEIEFMEMLKQSKLLTENELKYCRIVMNDHIEVRDSDVARIMKVSPSAVNQMKKSISKKFMTLQLVG